VTAFEDAKWVYIALRHLGIAVDVVSEQQIAEGMLDQYKAIYVVGPNLRRDAGAALLRWVNDGGTLWTDAMGLSRDEANQPSHEALTGLKDRKVQIWGAVEPYKATELKAFAEKDVPPAVEVETPPRFRPAVGREILATAAPAYDMLYSFVDDKPADATRKLGKGRVYVAGVWVGLCYSANVRHPDYDMSRDFTHETPGGGMLLTIALDNWDSYRRVYVPVPTVEAFPLVNKAGRRSVALMNWAYKHVSPKGEALVPAENLKVTLSGLGEIRSVRSATYGALKLDAQDGRTTVTLPRLEEIDLLILD
jgi:hypothetical protein